MASVLLLLDVQKNMLLPPKPVLGAATVGALIEDLLARARAAGAVVVHVRDTPGSELVHEVREGEHMVDRTTPDAFAGTGLAALIPSGTEVVVAGMRSELCVRATARAALDRGYAVLLVRGAHATYQAGLPREIEAELRAAGVRVVDPGSVTFGPAGG